MVSSQISSRNGSLSPTANGSSVIEVKEPPLQASTVEAKHEEHMALDVQKQQQQEEQQTVPMSTRTWRFWSVFLGCCLISLLSGIDATVITTALPTIVRELGGADEFVWVANSFVFAATVPQPLFAQTANIFGR